MVKAVDQSSSSHGSGCSRWINKSSAVAEMGDRAREKWSKNWGLMCPFRGGGGAGSPSNTMPSGPRPTSVALGLSDLDPSNRLATIHQRYRQTDRTVRTRVP